MMFTVSEVRIILFKLDRAHLFDPEGLFFGLLLRRVRLMRAFLLSVLLIYRTYTYMTYLFTINHIYYYGFIYVSSFDDTKNDYM